MSNKPKELVAFKCDPDIRAELKRVSESLVLTPSDVARAALREGLKIIDTRGIQPIRAELAS